MRDIKRLLGHLQPIYYQIGFLFLLVTITALLSAATPWFYREVINFLTTGEISQWFKSVIPFQSSQYTTLLGIVGLYVGVLLLEDIFANLRKYYGPITRTVSWQLLRKEALVKLQDLSMSFFYKNPPGAIAEKLNAGLRESFWVVRISIVDIWPTMIQFIVAVVAISFLNSTIALGLLVAIVIYAGLAFWRSKINRRAENLFRASMEDQARKWIGAITYQELIKQFAREQWVESEMNAIYKVLLDIEQRRYRAMAWISFVQELVWKLVVGLVYGYGGYLVLVEKTLSIGDLVLFVAYMDRVMGPLGYVLDMYDQLQVSLVSVRRMLELWDTPIEVKDVAGAVELKPAGGSVEFKNVSFRYREADGKEKKEMVFKNFNLKIKPHETVAIVGPSGAGKSTLVKLLLRFYDPDKGTIMIDNQAIDQVKQQSVRRNVSAILQDVMVLNTTIKENLKFAKPSATTKEMMHALKMANLSDFVNSLPKKLNTVLGERGLRLSGGERQRLGLARALLKDAEIIVLDEATSALDSENEYQIQQAIARVVENKTTIVIAHRLSTVKKADRIVVLKDGKIVEQGTHKSLLRKKAGYYKKLYSMQGVLLKD